MIFHKVSEAAYSTAANGVCYTNLHFVAYLGLLSYYHPHCNAFVDVCLSILFS